MIEKKETVMMRCFFFNRTVCNSLLCWSMVLSQSLRCKDNEVREFQP